MKIAVMTSGHVPSEWAHAISVMKHAHAFRELGHSVEVLTVERHLEATYRKRIDSIADWYGIEEIPITYFRDNWLYYFVDYKWPSRIIRILDRLMFGKLRYIFDPEKNISEYCREQGFRIAYCRTYRGAMYNIKLGIPTVLDAQNPNPQQNPQLRDLLSLAHSPFFKRLVTVSDMLKENFVVAGVPDVKIIVMENAVDVKKYETLRKRYTKDDLRTQLRLPHDKVIVTYTGKLSAERGVGDILSAAQRLNDFLFLIIGGRQNELEHFKYISQRKQLRNVLFTGFLPNSQIPLYTLASDILLAPYTRDTPTWTHLSPLKIFEYLAAGKPIITTNFPAMRKLLVDRQNGFLIKEKTPDDIVKALECLISNKNLYDRCVEKNIRQAKKFSYTSRAESILEGLI